MKKTWKFVWVFIGVFLALSLAGCSGQHSQDKIPTDFSSSETATQAQTSTPKTQQKTPTPTPTPEPFVNFRFYIKDDEGEKYGLRGYDVSLNGRYLGTTTDKGILQVKRNELTPGTLKLENRDCIITEGLYHCNYGGVKNIDQEISFELYPSDIDNYNRMNFFIRDEDTYEEMTPSKYILNDVFMVEGGDYHWKPGQGVSKDFYDVHIEGSFKVADGEKIRVYLIEEPQANAVIGDAKVQNGGSLYCAEGKGTGVVGGKYHCPKLAQGRINVTLNTNEFKSKSITVVFDNRYTSNNKEVDAEVKITSFKRVMRNIGGHRGKMS